MGLGNSTSLKPTKRPNHNRYADLNPPKHPHPTHSQQFLTLSKKNPDLREPSELRETGIIPSAHSLPLNTNPEGIFLPAPEFYDRFGFHKPGKSPSTGDDYGGEVKEVVFYCKAGVRSKAAARLAGGVGGWDGVKVGDMRGGWVEWEKRGGPVERVMQGRRK